MKKFSILASLACLLCMAVPATAGQTIKYRGDIDPSGRIAFKLVKGGGVQKIDKLKWKKLPVRCEGSKQTTTNGLGFSVKVVEHEFEAVAVLGDSKAPDAKAEITGTLKGGDASGTIKVSGKALPLDGDLTGRCRSGKLDWSASR
jgi:hypothetical protein